MGRKAIIIIHGLGSQQKFDTMNAFIKGYLKSKGGHPVHEIRNIGNKSVSCVCFRNRNDETDVLEYYWANHAENIISNTEVIEWLFTVAAGARKYYSDKQNMHTVNDHLFSKDGEFAYMTYLLDILGALRIFRVLFRMTLGNVKLMKLLTHLIDKPLRRFIADSLGDVTIYTAMDTNKKYHDIRETIITGAVNMFKYLMLDSYDSIEIYGHSLGSVIAYDALGRINREMNIDAGLRDFADKITKFVTFGSPLDKIAFFFDEQLDNEERRIRYNIVTQLHGFRRKTVDVSIIADGISSYFNHMKWLNYWEKSDPISGHLDVYSNVENIELDFSAYITAGEWFRKHYSTNSHSLYWSLPDIYK